MSMPLVARAVRSLWLARVVSLGVAGMFATLATPVVAPAQARLTGIAVDSLSGGRPLTGATIVLLAGSRYASVDPAGRFVFEQVPPGEHQLALLHPSLDSLDIALPPFLVRVPEHGLDSVVLAIPGAATLQRMLCGETDAGGLGVVVGTVAMPVTSGDTTSGDSTSDALPLRVRATWTDMLVENGKLVRTPRSVTQTPDSRGAFLLCGIPSSARVRIAAERGPDTVTAQTVAIGSRGVLRVALGDRVQGARGAQELEAVSVRAKSGGGTSFGVFGTYEGFEDRRRMGHGAFRVLDMVEQHALGTITDVLLTMRGILLGGSVVKPAPKLRGPSGARCSPSFFIDGNYVGGDDDQPVDFREIELMLPPSIVTAVEVYTGSASIPWVFDKTMRTGCGSIVVWTNRMTPPKR